MTFDDILSDQHPGKLNDTGRETEKKKNTWSTVADSTD